MSYSAATESSLLWHLQCPSPSVGTEAGSAKPKVRDSNSNHIRGFETACFSNKLTNLCAEIPQGGAIAITSRTTGQPVAFWTAAESDEAKKTINTMNVIGQPTVVGMDSNAQLCLLSNIAQMRTLISWAESDVLMPGVPGEIRQYTSNALKSCVVAYDWAIQQFCNGPASVRQSKEK